MFLPLLAGIGLGGAAGYGLSSLISSGMLGTAAGAAGAAGAGAGAAASTAGTGLLGLASNPYIMGGAMMGAQMASNYVDNRRSRKKKKEEEEKNKHEYLSNQYENRIKWDPVGERWTGGLYNPYNNDYMPMYRNNGGIVRTRYMAEGGQVGGSFDPMQSGLASLNMGGGQSQMRQVDKQIVQQAIMALTGQIAPEEPIARFIARFGRPALADLSMRMQEQDGEQDPGMRISGPGDGMSDDIPAQAGQMPYRLADGEFVVPADTVSDLGNGSSDAGADVLHNMIRRVRHERRNSSQQPPAIQPSKYLPA